MSEPRNHPPRRDRPPPTGAGRRQGERKPRPSAGSGGAPRESASGAPSGGRRSREGRPYYPPKASVRRAPRSGVDVDALLAHASDPNADLLAEAEAEIRQQEAEATAAEATTGPLDLSDRAALRGLLRRHGLRPNKSFGQHLLVDREALDAILAAADIVPEDSVLEVGAGTGVLTVELAARARRVVAVELDRAILPVLRETTARYPHVEIIARDLLAVEPDTVFGDAPYKLVANLPYYITALTLRHFLEAANSPRVLVVMVQQEVAERITAAPGDLSLLGLSVQFYGTPRIVRRVPASSFFPPPRVDSAIVRVDLLPAPPLTGADRERFFRLAHAGFAEKRKQLHNSLARNLRLPGEMIGRWLAGAAIDPARRAETLSVDDWLRLAEVARRDEWTGEQASENAEP